MNFLDNFSGSPGTPLVNHVSTSGDRWQDTGKAPGDPPPFQVFIDDTGEAVYAGGDFGAGQAYGIPVCDMLSANYDITAFVEMKSLLIQAFSINARVDRLTGQGYCFVLDYDPPVPSVAWFLRKGNAIFGTTLASGAMTFSPQVYEMELSVSGNTIVVKLNGVTLATVTDSTYTSAGAAQFFWFRQPSGQLTGFHLNSFAVTKPVTCNPYLNSARFDLRVAGEFDGDVFASEDYGLPTAIVVNSPVSGNVAIVDVPIADLANFATGRLGQCVIERVGGSENTFEGNVVVAGIELYGDIPQ